jgi:hypothetical protein
VYAAADASPEVTTVIDTAPGDPRAGIDEIVMVVPDWVKHPVAGVFDGHGSRTTGVPAACSAAVPISTAVALAVLVPVRVTEPPPVVGPIVGDAVTPDGAAGRVPAVVTVTVSGFASVDDTLVTEEFCTMAADMLEPVTMPTTVRTGRLVPLAKDDALVVQVIVWPTGVWHTHPVP